MAGEPARADADGLRDRIGETLGGGGDADGAFATLGLNTQRQKGGDAFVGLEGEAVCERIFEQFKMVADLDFRAEGEWGFAVVAQGDGEDHRVGGRDFVGDANGEEEGPLGGDGVCFSPDVSASNAGG